MSEQSTIARTPLSPAVVVAVDAVLVVVFAAIGYATHADGWTLAGTAGTAWPFLVALAVAHAVVRGSARLGSGLVVWLVTVAGGMVLRRLTGDGTAVSFVVVATLFNAATLLGWRLVAQLTRRA